jgi:hypothetical protein
MTRVVTRLVLACAAAGLALSPACKKKQEEAPPAAHPATPTAGTPTTTPTTEPTTEPTTPTTPTAPEPAAPPEQELATPQPQPAPADWPVYAKGVDLPADQYTVNATVNDKPANVTIKRDMMIGGVPCSAAAEVKFWDGELLAECTLAIDFTLEGMAFLQGTLIGIHPAGMFNTFTLPKAQLVKDVPLIGGTEFSLTTRFELSTATLARTATVQAMTFPPGTFLEWDSNNEKHPLQSARLSAKTTVLGTEYPAGAHVYFDEEGKVRMVRGIARPPAEPLACPEKSAATVESTNGGYPAGLAWTEIAGTNVHRNNLQKPLTENDALWVSLANFALPADFNTFNATLAAGQALIRLQVSRSDGKALEVGTYEVGPNSADDFYASPSIVVPDGVTVQFDSWNTEGTVEVVSLTPDRICGRFALSDSNSKIRGEFSAVLVP